MDKDPLPMFAKFLTDNGVMTAEEIAEVDKQVERNEDAIASPSTADTVSGELRCRCLFRYS